jgi:hypothetical protein
VVQLLESLLLLMERVKMILRLVFRPADQAGLFERAFIFAKGAPALVIDDLDRLLGVLGDQQVLFQDL